MSLEIETGEFVAVIGPSGSGKSTFMHILGCLDRPTSGRYILDGQDVSTLSKNTLATARSKKVGFVFQGFNLLPRTNALDNVELPLLYNGNGLRARDRHRRAREALAAVGLSDRAHHHPSQLSGGQQQRVAIARALHQRARHPCSRTSRRATSTAAPASEVMDIFQRLNTERGITVLLITHEQDIAEYGTRIIAFRDGRIVSDKPNAVRRVAADELAALPNDDDAVEPALNILRRAQVEFAELDDGGAAAATGDRPTSPPPAADPRKSAARSTTDNPPTPKE